LVAINENLGELVELDRELEEHFGTKEKKQGFVNLGQSKNET